MKMRVPDAWFCPAISALHGADLPTVTVEPLYHLQARADRVRRYKPDEMVEYRVARKVGGTGFEYANSQLFTVRVEVAKPAGPENVAGTDPRLVSRRRNSDLYTALPHEEAAKVQNGMIREGQIAADAPAAIAHAQSGGRQQGWQATEFCLTQSSPSHQGLEGKSG